MFAGWTLIGLPRAEVGVTIQGENHPQDRPMDPLLTLQLYKWEEGV